MIEKRGKRPYCLTGGNPQGGKNRSKKKPTPERFCLKLMAGSEIGADFGRIRRANGMGRMSFPDSKGQFLGPGARSLLDQKKKTTTTTERRES